ncbi:AraC family transcriptional regulator, partial [Enterococcus sp. S181_ASV_20]|nr:AraC family transcriptional regulator [Enterococcus sp. S181_ASV_20]
RQFDFLFLVEFHSSGLYPFLNIDQHHLDDKVFLFADLNQALLEQIAEAYYTAKTIHELASKLDQIFLEKIDQIELNPAFCIAFEKL